MCCGQGQELGYGMCVGVGMEEDVDVAVVVNVDDKKPSHLCSAI